GQRQVLMSPQPPDIEQPSRDIGFGVVWATLVVHQALFPMIFELADKVVTCQNSLPHGICPGEADEVWVLEASADLKFHYDIRKILRRPALQLELNRVWDSHGGG